MIPAKTLRIGNYVKHSSYSDSIFSIRSVSEDQLHPIGLIEHDKNSIYAIECTLDDLQPIPLTPEILEQFGFISTGEGDDFHDKPLWKHPATNYLYCEGYIVDNSGPYGHYCDIGGVQFLHQLQNLYFALTGKELAV